MAQEWARAPSGGTLLPISNATYIINAQPVFTEYSVHVRFLDARQNIVTPTGGTVTIRAGLLDGQFQAPSAGSGVINAAEAGPEATYTVVRFLGAVRRVRAVVDGITGGTATQMQILVAGVS